VGTAIATLVMIPVELVLLPRLVGLAPIAALFLVAGALYALASTARRLGRTVGERLAGTGGSPPGGPP